MRHRYLAMGALVMTLSACSPAALVEVDDNRSQSVGPSVQSAPQAEPQSLEEPQSAAEPTLPTLERVAARFDGVEPTSWGTDLPGVVTRMDSDGVALTLDACGGPGGSGYDAELIGGLIERGVPATLFLNERWIEENPEIASELAQNPLFEIANHGVHHLPLSVTGESAYEIPGTASPLEAAAEVWGNHLAITRLTGSAPRFFRSGTAHYDDVAVQIVEALGERVVGFTVNADGGATFDAPTVRGQVSGAAPGSIIIAHMNQPDGETAEGLLAGVDDLLASGVRMSLIENPM